MRVTARGWNRDMGQNEIASMDLSQCSIRRDGTYSIHLHQTALNSPYSDVTVRWGKKLHLTGNYLMKLELTRDDVVQLFKASFGTELDVDLIERHGFTVSEELSRTVLGKVKLADLTLGDLAKIATASAETEPVPNATTAEIRQFVRPPRLR
jgi:hypothetical protein